MRLVFIGHSHLGSLFKAQIAYQTIDEKLHDIDFYSFTKLGFPDGFDNESSDWSINRSVFNFSPDKLKELEGEQAVIVLVLYGNEHNVFGMIKAPKPFDFYDGSTQPVDLEATIIPLAVMRRTVEHNMKRILSTHQYFKAASFRVISIITPPPVPSPSHIMQNPGLDYVGKLGKEINDKQLRLKLWRLWTDYQREQCRESEYEIIEPASEALDSEGFLGEQFWSKSPIHASPEYGKLMLEKVLETL
jgi:hypothetical protein